MESDSQHRTDKNMTLEEIQSLLCSTETSRIERTESTGNMDKFQEAICAFSNDMSNSRQNGYLIIGAKDNGTLSGLKVDDALFQVMSEKVCKILLRPSPPAWGTPSRRGICDVDFSLSFYLIFHSRKYGSRLAYVPSVFSLATEPKR